MTETTPKAWLCKHCNERVDPTMAFCWSCGRDKLGESKQDVYEDIEFELTAPVGGADRHEKLLSQRGLLTRVFFLSWCSTGLFVMVAGTDAITDRYHYPFSTADYLVVIGFYFSILLSFALIADRLFFRAHAESDDVPMRSDELHRPWIRRWMTRGWGSVLFWFAWVWLLLNFLP